MTLYNEPPYSIEEIYSRVCSGIKKIDHGDVSALKRLADIEQAVPCWLKQHKELSHSFPSPSGVMECRLKQFFQGRGYEPDQESPIGWQIRRAMGIIIEPLILSYFSAGGFGVTLPDTSYQCGPLMLAHPDAIINNEFLLEIKSISGIGYRKLIESSMGVRETEIGHLVQAQLYLYATEMEWCLYFAAPADFSLIQMMLRQRKRFGKDYEMPPIYLEFIKKDNNVIEMGLERAETISEDIKKEEPPPKEFSGRPTKTDGSRNPPCSWCLWISTCNSVSYPTDIKAGIRFVQ